MSDPENQPQAAPAGGDTVGQEAYSLLRQNWGWVAGAAAALVLFYYLGPILAPFLVSGGLAYLVDPLVDRL